MPTMDECIDDIAATIAALQHGGPVLRLGVIQSVGGSTIQVDGFSMAFLVVGVTPVAGRIAAYLRQGTGAVAIGMLAV